MRASLTPLISMNVRLPTLLTPVVLCKRHLFELIAVPKFIELGLSFLFLLEYQTMSNTFDRF